MRLIDADALLAECQLAQKQADRHGREFANAFYSGGGDVSTEWWCVEDMIENAPTIEPEREKGKWRHYEGYLTCSECRTEYDDDIMTHCCDDVPKFCPNCGASMKEDNNGGSD